MVSTLWILSPDESTVLDVLSPDHVTIEETREIGKPRQIKVTHPIREFSDDELERYISVIRQGNKIWWPETLDGDSCLYVINSSITIDPLLNQITFYAEDVSVELSYLPPIEFPTVFSDKFTHGLSSAWITQYGGGSHVLTNGAIRLNGNYSNTYSLAVPVSGSFTAMTKIKTLSLATYADGGIRAVFSNNPTNGYQLVIVNDNGTIKLKLAYNTGSWVVLTETAGSFSGVLLTLLMSFDGTNVTFQYSTDGKTFTDFFSEASRGTITHVGMKVGSSASVLFDDFTIYSPSGFKKTVDSTLIGQIIGSQFDIGSVASGDVFLGGYYSPMNAIKEIEAQTGKEFQFTYTYDPTTKKIQRTADFLDSIGNSLDVVFDPLTDFEEFRIVEDETDTFSQAVPVYKEDKDPKKTIDIADAINKFKSMGITKDSNIPSHVYETNEGKAYNAANKPAPYSKTADTLYVTANDTKADYRTIYTKTGNTAANKTLYVEASELNPYNLYWQVSSKLAESESPTIKIEAKINDTRLKDLGTTLKVGDKVKVKLPWSFDLVELRVEKTTKNTSDLSNFQIELGNREITATNKWIGQFKPTTPPTKLR